MQHDPTTPTPTVSNRCRQTANPQITRPSPSSNKLIIGEALAISASRYRRSRLKPHKPRQRFFSALAIHTARHGDGLTEWQYCRLIISPANALNHRIMHIARQDGGGRPMWSGSLAKLNITMETIRELRRNPFCAGSATRGSGA